MKRYAHKIDEEILHEGEESAKEFVQGLQPELNTAKAERNATFFQMLGKEFVSLGAYAYAFERPVAQVVKLFKDAAGHLARAIDCSYLMDVFEYMDYLSLAVVVNDPGFAKRLASLPRTAYTNEDVDASEVSFVAAEIEAGLVLGEDQKLPGTFARAEKALQSKKTGRYDKIVTESLIALARAVAARNQGQFDQALAAREKDFKRLYGGPDDRESPDSLIDIKGLALIRLAAERGLRCQTASTYLPVELLRGKA